MVLYSLITLIRAPYPAMQISVFAMKTLPDELLQLISEWYPKSNQEFIANNSIRLQFHHYSKHYFVNLANKNISSLFHWNFSLQHRNISSIDLSGNNLQKVSERFTTFGNIDMNLDFGNNHIESVDLRRTQIRQGLYLHNNSISSESFRLNQVLPPHRLIVLGLSENPIHYVSNYSFPQTATIFLRNCGILLLENVVFDAGAVYLDDNPGIILKNVTFIGTKYLSLVGCNITEEQLSTLNIHWDFAEALVVRLNLYGYPKYLTREMQQQRCYKSIENDMFRRCE